MTDTPRNNTTELRLLGRVISGGEIGDVLDRGITPGWFTTPENVEVFKYVRDFFSKYGSLPTGPTVKQNFPEFRIVKSEENIEALTDMFIEEHKRRETADMLQTAITAYEDNAEAALNLMASRAGEILDIGSFASGYIDLNDNAESRMAEYEEIELNPDGLLGVTTGFRTLDRASLGLQPGQLSTVIAKPKVGKSTLTLLMAIEANRAQKKVFYQTIEMSAKEQQYRADSFRSRINWNTLVSGKMSEPQKRHLRRTLAELANYPQMAIEDARAGLTVSSLHARLQKRKPDIAFVDGVYLMQDEVTGEYNTPQALTNITRAMKRLAQRLNIPIVMSTQVLPSKAKGNAVRAEDIGYSSSFFQDSDNVVALERTEDDDRRVLRIEAARNLQGVRTELNWDWQNVNFSEFYGDE